MLNNGAANAAARVAYWRSGSLASKLIGSTVILPFCPSAGESDG